MHSWLSAKHRASLQASGGWARDDEEDGGKALNARQEEDGRQKPIRQPESRVPSFSQLFRPLEDQDTARNECEKKKEKIQPTADENARSGGSRAMRIRNP